MSESKKPSEKINTQLSYSLLASPISPSSFKDLGVTSLVSQLGLDNEQTHGHWCSRCQGIWFGCTLEVQCPACGNRSG